MSKASQFLHGVQNTLPILLGVIPFGMIYGVLAIKAGLAASAAQGMSLILFAGSAQFMVVQLIGAGTPWLVIVFTAFIVNLRHALYSASLAPYVKPLAPAWKGLLAYLLTDEAYAVAISHYDRHGSQGAQHWYYLGTGLALWSCWQISTALGIFLGAQIPAQWSLDFTLALTFIALLIPALKDRPMILAAASAAVTAVAANALPYKAGLILAALVGIGVGLWSEGVWQKAG
jgi:4-azaleucine resistance transporter AzlC